MSGYLSYFLVGLQQVSALGTVLVLWAALSALGGWLAGRQRMTEGDALYGWAAVAFIFTVLGVLFSLPFTYVAWGTLAVALAAIVVRMRRGGEIFSGPAIRAALVAAPLFIVASALEPSQWDEFSHWLPASRFLFLTDGFPGTGNPVTGTQMLYAYPFGWPLLTYMASRIAGHFVENAGALLNLFLLLSFGLMAVRVALSGAGREDAAGRGWALAAVAVLAGTLLNPTFSQKVVLTAYADTSTAVAVAFGAVLGWRTLGALAGGETGLARRLAWQFGLVMVVLVGIKQVNLTLFVILVFAVGLAGLRDPAVPWRGLVRQLPVAIIPGLAAYGLWRYHVATALADPVLFPHAEATLMPFADWNVALIPQILLQMLVVASKKGVFFGVMAVAIFFAVRGFVRFRGPFDRLAIVVAGTFLGYNAFLLFVYVASFGAVDALRAVSYWRYNMHVGLLAGVFGAYAAGVLWQHFPQVRRRAAALGALAVMVAVGAPLAFPHKLRIDLEPPKPHFWAVATSLRGTLAAETPLFILDPLGTGESAVITRYRLNRHAVPYFSAFHGDTAEAMGQFTSSLGPGARLLVHSVTPPARRALALELKENVSYLLAKEGASWRILHRWPHPAPPGGAK